MNSQGLKKYNIPDTPGVYFFLKGKNILYIGKATSLRSRIKSYLNKDLISTRGPVILDMVTQSDNLKWEETGSVLEALILEANLIKKHQPKYNTKEKDNKSFNYVCITKEVLPKVLIIRGRNLNKEKYESVFGPFPNGSQLKDAMKIIRPIFPYLDNDSSKKNNREFYRQLGLTPVIDFTLPKYTFRNVKDGRKTDPLVDYFKNNNILTSFREYKNDIKNLKLFFQGKKKNIISNFKKEMMVCAKKKEFEKANEIKKRIFAIEHINDISLIKEDSLNSLKLSMGEFNNFRIEAYDIAHMNGRDMVGVMTVIENGEVKKSDYKKFIIKTQAGANDTGALEEVLSRRLRHTEWGLPNLIVVDGGKAQINVAKRVINRYQFLDISIVSVLKDERHKPKLIIGDEKIINDYKKYILLANNESHRFAITFHKKKRGKSFLK